MKIFQKNVLRRVVSVLLLGIIMIFTASAATNTVNCGKYLLPTDELADNTVTGIDETAASDETILNDENEPLELEDAPTYETRNPPLTEYYFTEIRGTFEVQKDKWEEDTIAFEPKYGTNEIVYAGTVDITRPFSITYYKYGNGSGLGFKSTSQYKVSNTEGPFDFVMNSWGAAIGYKQRETFTMLDQSLSEITLTSTARSRVAPKSTFIRKIHITFGNSQTGA